MASILIGNPATWPIRRPDVIPGEKGIKNPTGAYIIRACGNKALAIDEWLHASGLGLKRKRLENLSYRAASTPDASQ